MKAELKAARENLAKAGITEDIEKLVKTLNERASQDPGIVALTSVICTHAAALVEYIDGKVSPQTVSVIAANACAVPWADKNAVRTLLLKAHAICQTTQEKAAAAASAGNN